MNVTASPAATARATKRKFTDRNDRSIEKDTGANRVLLVTDLHDDASHAAQMHDALQIVQRILQHIRRRCVYSVQTFTFACSISLSLSLANRYRSW
jgi:hypothetical protein